MLTDNTREKMPMWLLMTAIIIMYCVLPIFVYLFVNDDWTYLTCASLAFLSVIGIQVGQYVPLFDVFSGPNVEVYVVDPEMIIKIALLLFSLFVVVTLATADSIPILSALSGADINSLSEERGDFLKGREGPWIVLLYLSTILTSTLMPYAVAMAILVRSRYRVYILTTTILFSMVFLVKALFLNFILPLVSMSIGSKRISMGDLLLIGLASFGILLFLVNITGYGSLEGAQEFDAREYFSTSYIPSSALDFIFYRAVTIPVISVVDTLTVFDAYMGGVPLLGATSSPIAAIFGIEKVNIERMVFEYQYGGWNETANSNVAFFVDGYVNFGTIGCLGFGVIVGQMFRILRRSRDPAINALALLLAFQLYISPLIQMLLSNGWLVMIVFALLFRANSVRDEYRDLASE